MTSFGLQDCLLPSHFFQLMEIELENHPKLTKEKFIPIFIVNLIREALSYRRNTTVKEGDEFGCPSPNHLPWSGSTSQEELQIFEDSYLLPNDQKVIIQRILLFALHSKNIRGLEYDLVQFALKFCGEIEFPCLELLWLMDSQFKLLSITSYLMKLKSKHQLDYFANQFVAFCFSSSLHDSATSGRALEILNDFLRSLFISSYCNPDSNLALTTLRNISLDILNRITQKLISEDLNQSSLNHKFLIAILQGVPVMESVKKRYFTAQLSALLAQTSQQKLTDILQHQEKFADEEFEKQRKQDTIALFIGAPQTKSDIIEVLRKSLKDLKILNWENVLHTVTTWAKMYSEMSYEIFVLMKDLIRALITIGLNEGKEDEIMVSFILARHCCLIAPLNFSRYERWFTSMFENENALTGTAPKFEFLIKTLSKWIPIEPPSFLQVHISYRPFIPSGCRDTWTSYSSLAKVRIAEYNDVEDAMEYEPNPNNPVQYDVEMAIKTFDNSNKIPQSVVELIFFRKQYYTEHFLPTLIKRPLQANVSDARLRFIEALNIDGKIPSYIYADYKANNQL